MQIYGIYLVSTLLTVYLFGQVAFLKQMYNYNIHHRTESIEQIRA